MSLLSNFLSLVDEKLGDVFHHTPADPAKARKPFLRAIEKAGKAFAEGKQPRGEGKFWSANNNVVAFTPNYAGKPVLIDGKATHFIPAERFPDALKALAASVEAGEFDKLLTSEDEGMPKAAAAPKEKKTRAPHSPERKARDAAAREARKAAAAKAK